MIKALFFDIDGTLVSFHTHRIPRSTVESLEKAKISMISKALLMDILLRMVLIYW